MVYPAGLFQSPFPASLATFPHYLPFLLPPTRSSFSGAHLGYAPPGKCWTLGISDGLRMPFQAFLERETQGMSKITDHSEKKI